MGNTSVNPSTKPFPKTCTMHVLPLLNLSHVGRKCSDVQVPAFTPHKPDAFMDYLQQQGKCITLQMHSHLAGRKVEAKLEFEVNTLVAHSNITPLSAHDRSPYYFH